MGWVLLIRTQLIRSSTLFEVFVKGFAIISCLKCMVNLYFHLFQKKSLLTNDFELTVPDLYASVVERNQRGIQEWGQVFTFARLRMLHLVMY